MRNDIDINKIAVSKKFPFGKQDFKYFIGYKNNKLLCIFFSEMSKHKRGIVSQNIRKAFFSEKISTFLILEPESFISQNLRNFFQSEAFLFFELGLKFYFPKYKRLFRVFVS